MLLYTTEHVKYFEEIAGIGACVRRADSTPVEHAKLLLPRSLWRFCRAARGSSNAAPQTWRAFTMGAIDAIVQPITIRVSDKRMPSTNHNEPLKAIATFADELPVAIWVGQVPSGECVYVNKAFRQVLGIDPPEGASRGNYVGPYSVHTLDGRPYPENEMPYERALAARGLVEIDDMYIQRHDGGRTYLRVYARPLFDESGEITHIVEAFTDITREVRSKQVQLEREVQLRQAQRLESLGSLAGGIAHDFNNLLTIVKVIATDLLARSDSAEIQDGLRQIDDVTESATRLTRALLGFARQGKNLKQRTSVNEIAERVATMAERTVGRHIEVKSELCREPLHVEGDPSQLEQVLMNLVLNARDAIQEHGTLIIRTRTDELQNRDLSALSPGRYAVIEVEDTGTGIPQDVTERIFEPYFTTKTAGAVKGTGLGLATVFGIVETHGGTVTIAHTGPRGTTMRVLLPLLDDSEVTGSRNIATKQREISGRGTILVVDDEPLVLRVTASALEALGYRVLKALNGAEAMVLFKQHKLDAIVLDLVMPTMGGRETFMAMRAIDPDVRVLLITGYGLNYEAQALLDLGIRAFVAKPFSVAELSSALSQVLAPPKRG